MKKIGFISISIFLFLYSLVYSTEADDQELYNLIAKEDEWIPIEYLMLLTEGDRDMLKLIIPGRSFGRVDTHFDGLKEWYEWYFIESINYDRFINDSGNELRMICFRARGSTRYDVGSVDKVHNSFHVKLILKGRDIYWADKLKDDSITPIRLLNKAPSYLENPSYWDEKLYELDEIIIDARFIFDGDYLTVWANEDTFKQVYFRCTAETLEQLNLLIATNKFDLSKVTWPRHADGSCDYEDTTSVKTASTAITSMYPNKIMTVKENLRLRSGEGTSSQVVTVLPTGSRVKVLEVGKTETIDGISSNWVLVESQSHTKDRDGKIIYAGTQGWCFGGYLE